MSPSPRYTKLLRRDPECKRWEPHVVPERTWLGYCVVRGSVDEFFGAPLSGVRGRDSPSNCAAQTDRTSPVGIALSTASRTSDGGASAFWAKMNSL